MARQKILLKTTEALGVISAAASSTAVAVTGGQTLSFQVVADVTTGNKTFTPSDVNTGTNIVTIASHGYKTGAQVQVSNGTALPSPLAGSTNYYIIAVSTSTLKFATSAANALAGTAITLTDGGTGTTTIAPVAISGGSVGLYKSNDGTNWILEGSATNITVDASIALSKVDPEFEQYKLTFAISAGSMDLTIYCLAKGIDG